MLLATSQVADSHQRINTGQLVRPDEVVNSACDDFAHPVADATVQAAMRWLTQPARVAKIRQ